MEFNELVKNIEAMIFASDRPLPVDEIQDLINHRHSNQKEKENLHFEEEIETDSIVRAIETISEKYAAEYYPFEIKYTGGGYCFLTKKEFHDVVVPVCQEKKIKRLSSAAMETLAIIAYKQPVTKAEIEYLRGVSADYSVQKLMEKELIVVAGRKEEAIGKPLLYRTAENFLDYLGIQDFSELPKLNELFDINKVDASAASPMGAIEDTEDETSDADQDKAPDLESEADGKDRGASDDEIESSVAADDASSEEPLQKVEQATPSHTSETSEMVDAEVTDKPIDIEERKEALHTLNKEASNINKTEEE